MRPGSCPAVPRGRVIGSGTVLDTARLKQLLGEELAVDSRNIHAFIIGEHGDSELAVWSGANVSGIDLDQFCQLRGGVDNCHLDQLYRRVRDSAYEIIRRKGATYYGIAMAVGRIAQCLVRDEHSVLPVSVVLVGRNGLEEVLEIPLNGEERQALEDSARQMKEAIESLDL